MWLFALIALVLLLVGYKWFRVYQLMLSREPTPPSVWTAIIWPRTVVLLLFGAILVWAATDWLFHR
jgi:hypothetical protein